MALEGDTEVGVDLIEEVELILTSGKLLRLSFRSEVVEEAFGLEVDGVAVSTALFLCGSIG